MNSDFLRGAVLAIGQENCFTMGARDRFDALVALEKLRILYGTYVDEVDSSLLPFTEIIRDMRGQMGLNATGYSLLSKYRAMALDLPELSAEKIDYIKSMCFATSSGKSLLNS